MQIGESNNAFFTESEKFSEVEFHLKIGLFNIILMDAERTVWF